jgi:glycosyltransferase involved in cell wall biosynthesis
MLSHPKITVILAVLNMQETVSRAIASVRAQNYPATELIVFDGKSTDGTLDEIRKHQDIIAYWQSSKDKGHSDACNKALKHVTGDFIVFLNADDVFEKNLFNKVSQVYQTNADSKIISCGAQIINESDKNNPKFISKHDSPLDLDISLYNSLMKFPLLNTRFFHRSIFETHGDFKTTCDDGSYYISNDRDFFVRLALAGVQTKTIPEPLYTYYAHAASLTLSSTNILKIYKEHRKLAEKLLIKFNTNKDEIHYKIVKQWLTKDTAYSFCYACKESEFKKGLEIAKYGVKRCGPINLALYVAYTFSTFLRKKLLRSFPH